MKRESPIGGLRRKAADELRAWAESLDARKDEAVRTEASERRRRRHLRLGVILGGVVIAWGGAAAYFFWPVKSDPIAQGALGTWHTADAGYAGRAFELSATELTFRAAGIDMAYTIRRIRRTPSGAAERYTIEYEDTGTLITLEVVFDPARRTLRFANQPEVIWRPAEP